MSIGFVGGTVVDLAHRVMYVEVLLIFLWRRSCGYFLWARSEGWVTFMSLHGYMCCWSGGRSEGNLIY